MITHQRPEYVRLSLPRLLESCDDDTHVWLWHNADDEETLEAVRQHASDPRVANFHHSRENVALREPTNWLWSNAPGDYVGKVDDDCLVEDGWVGRLRRLYADFDGFGALAGSLLRDGDFDPELAAPKISEFPGGHRVLRNLWVQGSGYIVPTAVVRRLGPLGASQSWTQYCIEIARVGLVNGWPLPLMPIDHMDDPRSPYTLLKTDADIERYMPLSAKRNNVRTVAEWEAQLRRSGRLVQTASTDLRDYDGFGRTRHRIKKRLRRLVSGREW
jgi:hypothetical protein